MLSLLQKYNAFRFRQLYRMVKDAGIGNLIILIPLVYVAILGILQYVSTSKDISTAVFLLVGIGSFHWTRKDRFFLEQIKIPLFLIFLMDYILLCSPIWACFIFWLKWENLLLFGAGTLILSFVKPRYNSGSSPQKLNLFKIQWIPIQLFEWRCGLRKSMIGFAFLWLIGLIFSFYPIVIPVVLLLMALSITSFFQFFENKDLLLAVNQNQKLLRIKTFGSMKLFNLFMLPHYILFLYFHHSGYQYIGALVVVAIISNMIIVFAICLKYKNYRFHHHKVYSGLPLGIFVACLFVPFLWPIPILMLITFWRKAQENLLYHYA